MEGRLDEERVRLLSAEGFNVEQPPPVCSEDQQWKEQLPGGDAVQNTAWTLQRSFDVSTWSDYWSMGREATTTFR